MESSFGAFLLLLYDYQNDESKWNNLLQINKEEKREAETEREVKLFIIF